jgi:hypothetical protein
MASRRRRKAPQPDVTAAVLGSAAISPQHREAIARFVVGPSPDVIAEYPELLFPGTINEIQATCHELLASAAHTGGGPGPSGPEALELAGKFAAAAHILQAVAAKRP